MTVAKAPQFSSFEAYLATPLTDLPEGHYEYWDGELLPVMSESLDNGTIAVNLFLALLAIGVARALIHTHFCEVEVPGKPRTRFPDLVLLESAHLTLLKKRATITQDMPPPRLIAEVVSPGDEQSDNYQRDYIEKTRQYAAIGVCEYWIIDPERALVKIGCLINGTYEFNDFFANDAWLQSPSLPHLSFTVGDLLNVVT
jgi:Uma2 family endonuclease